MSNWRKIAVSVVRQVFLKHRSIVVRGYHTRLPSRRPALRRHLTMLPRSEPGCWEHRATEGRPGDRSPRSRASRHHPRVGLHLPQPPSAPGARPVRAEGFLLPLGAGHLQKQNVGEGRVVGTLAAVLPESQEQHESWDTALQMELRNC